MKALTASFVVVLLGCGPATQQGSKSDVPPGTFTITAEQIEKSGARTAWQVLKHQAPMLQTRDDGNGRPASLGRRARAGTGGGGSRRDGLARPRRPSLAGRPLPSSRVCSMGAWCFSTCHAIRAPDFSICSAVIVNVPGGTSLFEPCWVAGPQPSSTTTNDAVSAFIEASRFTSYSRVASEERQGIGRARP